MRPRWLLFTVLFFLFCFYLFMIKCKIHILFDLFFVFVFLISTISSCAEQWCQNYLDIKFSPTFRLKRCGEILNLWYLSLALHTFPRFCFYGFCLSVLNPCAHFNHDRVVWLPPQAFYYIVKTCENVTFHTISRNQINLFFF